MPFSRSSTLGAVELLTRESDPVQTERVAVICHEFRNSLAVLRGAIRLMRSPASESGLTTARTLIERQIDKMARHVDDLTEPRRHNGKVHDLRPSEIDLRVTARNAVDAIWAEVECRRHRLAISLPEEPVWAHGDGDRLEQALYNLLINACKYTSDGGDITLTMEKGRDRVWVRVRDSGVGIEPAMLSRIFGMFVQVDQPLPHVNDGSGIGLAVVKSVVELHGGSVQATSAGLGLGSEFTIALPAASCRSAIDSR